MPHEPTIKPGDDRIIEAPIYWHAYADDRVMRIEITEPMKAFDLLLMRRMLANARTPEHAVSVLGEFVSMDNVAIDVCRFKRLLDPYDPKRAA